MSTFKNKLRTLTLLGTAATCMTISGLAMATEFDPDGPTPVPSTGPDQTILAAKAAYAANPTAANWNALTAATAALTTGPGSNPSVTGPDGGGYTGYDSLADGVPFQFIDISGTGAMVFDGDDVSSGPMALSLPFEFYGEVLTDLVMASNGYISSDPTDTGPDLSNDCPLPAVPSTGGGSRMYPLHDDLISTGYMQYFSQCPRRSDTSNGNEGCTVFQWSNASFWPDVIDQFEMQTIIYHGSNSITYQVGANVANGAGSTTGTQDSTATNGLTMACDTAGSIPDNYAASILPSTATFIAGGAVPIIPTLNIFGLLSLASLLAGIAVFRARKRKLI